MFKNTNLQNLLDTSSVIQNQSTIIAEWNLNTFDNIDEIGNYRNRPSVGNPNGTANTTFAKETVLTVSPSYYGATDSSITISGGYTSADAALAFNSIQDKRKLLFSLQDCFGRFRPRSGINKAVFYSTNTPINYSNQNIFDRPRYYLADKDDKFKYWTSFRTESNGTTTPTERGISKTDGNSTPTYYIDDAAPFVKYTYPIPSNRIIVKMQTNVGTFDAGTFADLGRTYSDPFYGASNKTTPVSWKIQTLQGSIWTDAISFNSLSTRSDGSAIIKEDGYVELAYGITNIPTAYKSNMVFAGKYSSTAFLPTTSIVGYTYLIQNTSTDIGTYYIWQGTAGYTSFVPTYGWYLNEEGMTNLTAYEVDLVTPDSYISGTKQYRNFQYIQGIRIIANTMNKADATLDIIEISPRLTANITDKV